MKKLLLHIAFTLLTTTLFAQRPSGNSQNSGPLQLETTADYIIYVGLPILVVILYFAWRAKEKKEKEGNN